VSGQLHALAALPRGSHNLYRLQNVPHVVATPLHQPECTDTAGGIPEVSRCPLPVSHAIQASSDDHANGTQAFLVGPKNDYF
jgi:hypothetical protein